MGEIVKYQDNVITLRVPSGLNSNEIMLIQMFMEAMLFKLGAKASEKTGFHNINVTSSIDRLHEEIKEAQAEVTIKSHLPAMLEFADVANFALLAFAAASRGDF